MEGFFDQGPTHMRMLIVADADIASATALAEHFVPQTPVFDAVLVCGPFCQGLVTKEQDEMTLQERAVLMGEIGSTLAQFENIVCRVIYLGASSDLHLNMPGKEAEEERHLTPNSVSIHARSLPLTDDLYIAGFAETASNLSSHDLPPDVDRSAESDDELDGVEIKAGVSSVAVLEELLSSAASAATTREDGSGEGGGASTGIFALSCKYAHTLNHFLFHMPEAIEKAGVKVCIIPPAPDSTEPARLPKTFGNMTIAALGSLRLKSQYTVLELIKPSGDVKGPWATVRAETCTLGDRL
jgi:hypothetical protein